MSEAEGFPSLQATQKTGAEPFRQGDVLLKRSLLDFWRWSASDLVGNAMRGILAEYIVACALDLPDCVRVEWDAFDIKTPCGLKIEVKSAAFLQSWHQKTLSKITFGIQPTLAWDAGTNMYKSERRRQADIYIFCLLHYKDKTTVDPMNMEQWTFYILPASVLDERFPRQKSIGLMSLLKLKPLQCAYEELAEGIETIDRRIS